MTTWDGTTTWDSGITFDQVNPIATQTGTARIRTTGIVGGPAADARIQITGVAAQHGTARLVRLVTAAIGGQTRVQIRPEAAQTGEAYIHAIASAITSIEFITQPAGPGGDAILLVWSAGANVAAAPLPTGPPTYSVDDNGQIIKLTGAPKYVRAYPVGVGTARVFIEVTQNGVAMPGELLCTVSSVNGQLVAEWVPGTITPVAPHG